MNHIKPFIAVVFFFFTLCCAISHPIKGQSKAEAVEVTLTGYYTEFICYITGHELWIDLNHNGILDPGEELLSGKKMIKSIPNRFEPQIIYGKAIEEITIYDIDYPDQVKAIDLTQTLSLKKLNLRGNPISGVLDLKSCSELTVVKLQETSLESIDATNCYSLTHLYASHSPNLKKLLLADCNRLSWLEAEHCIIENPMLRGAISLSSIYLDDNELTELNIPIACTNLKTVSVSNNPNLKELSIPAIPTMSGLYASRCGLSEIDLSRGAMLESVDLSCNELRELKIHVNPIRLKELRIHQNKFSLEAMKKLVSVLPADDKSTTEKRLFVINTLGTTPREANVCSRSTVALAKHRGWDVYNYYGGTEQFYEGSEDPIIDPTKEGFIITTQHKQGEELTVDVKGSSLFIDLNGNNICDSGESLKEGLNKVRLTERQNFTIYGSHITQVRLPFNALTSIDFSQAPHVEILGLNNNLLEFVDLSAQKALRELDLSSNQLQSVLLPSSAPMTSLNLAFNKLSAIELPAYHSLQWLWINNNKISAFSPMRLKSLLELHIEVNKIDLIAMRQLVSELTDGNASEMNRRLYVVNTSDLNEGNHISKSMVTSARSKGWIVYDGESSDYEGEEDDKLGNHSESIVLTFGAETQSEITFFPKGEECWIDLNGNDSYDIGEEVDARNGEKRIIRLGSRPTITLYGKQITELRFNDQMHITKVDASKAHSIELLWIRNNDLTEICLPEGKTLQELDLSNNKLSGEIDLTPYMALKKIFLVSNAYRKVLVSGLQNLRVLSLTENELSQIDLTKCDNLEELYIASNYLQRLSCSSLKKLETLSVFQNQIKQPEMQQLVDDLNNIPPSSPIRGKSFHVLYVDNEGMPLSQERNELSDKQIAQAQAKQWSVLGWKEEGGSIAITALQEIVSKFSTTLSYRSTTMGWIIEQTNASKYSDEITVFSIEGDLLYRGESSPIIELQTPLHKAILYYAGESYLLIR